MNLSGTYVEINIGKALVGPKVLDRFVNSRTGLTPVSSATFISYAINYFKEFTLAVLKKSVTGWSHF